MAGDFTSNKTPDWGIISVIRCFQTLIPSPSMVASIARLLVGFVPSFLCCSTADGR
jgi:hypothetical protein